MKELFFGVGIVAAVFVLLVVLAVSVLNWECNGYQEATGKPTKVVGGNCYVKDQGEWYQWSEYKNRLVTKGALN